MRCSDNPDASAQTPVSMSLPSFPFFLPPTLHTHTVLETCATAWLLIRNLVEGLEYLSSSPLLALANYPKGEMITSKCPQRRWA